MATGRTTQEDVSRSAVRRSDRSLTLEGMRWIAWLGVCGCTAGLPTATRGTNDVHLDAKTLAVPGETMEFKVALRGITVGLVQTAIGRPGWIDGRHAIIVKSRGHSDGVISMFGDLTWELTTTLDLERGAPISDKEEDWIDVAGKQDHDDDERTWSEGDTVHDLHSAVTAVRGWDSRQGDKVTFDVSLAGMHLDVALWEAGREPLPTGITPAVRYDGTVAGGFHFATWLSDDTQRVPLLLRAESKWGALTTELVDYQPPKD